MMNCDALLMLGTDFPYQQFYPKNARILQVDIREEQLEDAATWTSVLSEASRKRFPHCFRASSRNRTEPISMSASITTAKPAKDWTIWRQEDPASALFIPNTSPKCSMKSPLTTPYSPWMSELR